MRIAIVCAQNRDHNTGMTTVDRAAERFFAGRDVDLTWLVLGKADRHTHRGLAGALGHKCLFEDPDFPGEYDRIVFWGDFHHSHSHWQAIRDLMVAEGIAHDTAAAYESIMKRVALEGAPVETLQKTALLGSTIYPDGADALADVRYQSALTSLISNARSARFRDPVSAYRAKMMTGRDAVVGMDLAFLNMVDRSWNTEAQERRKSGAFRLGVYCGRSGRWNKYRFLASLRVHGARARSSKGMEIIWIPWLRSEAAGTMERVFLGKGIDRHSADDPLDLIASCDAVATDTYHAFINAWCAGIPAILIGTGALRDQSSIGSKKKELLAFGMHATENYFFWEDLTLGTLPSSFSRMLSALLDEDRNAQIFERQKQAAQRFSTEIAAEIGLTDTPRS